MNGQSHVQRSLSLGQGVKENLPKSLERIRARRDRLEEHPEWKLSQVEIDMMILCGIVDGLVDGSISRIELEAQTGNIRCPKCGSVRPGNGMLCWNCGAR